MSGRTRLVFVRVPEPVARRVSAGERIEGVLRPKRKRGDGPPHGSADAVFEPASKVVSR